MSRRTSYTGAAGGLTPFEQLLYDANNDESVKKEISEEKRVGFYRVKQKLGSGNFSEVKLGQHLLTKDKVAVKILDKFKLDSKTQKLVTREMDIMKKMYHPHTVRFYEEIETISKLYIVLEYCAHGDLHAKLTSGGKMAEKDARPIYAQIISAVDYLHSVHIVHRDIKAENIYFATPRFIKVGDFGFSTFATKDDALATFCGSPPYAAPELYKDQSYNGTLVDVWALGVLLYYMVTSMMPFRADNFPRLKSIVMTGQYSVPDFLSDSCVSLLRSMLKLSPRERTGIAQVKKSAWLEDQEFIMSYDEVASSRGGDSDDDRDDDGTVRRRSHHKSRSNRHNKEQEAARDAAVRLQMKEFGISDEIIDRQKHGIRNSVTGVYRLLIHRLEKNAFKREIDDDDGYGTSGNGGSSYHRSDGENRNKNGKSQSTDAQKSNAQKSQKSPICNVL